MRRWVAALFLCASCQKAPSPLRAVPFESVKLTDSFWLPRLSTNRTVTIPHILRQNEETGRVDNFRKAAGLIPGEYQGRRFNDTDIHKIPYFSWANRGPGEMVVWIPSELPGTSR